MGATIIDGRASAARVVAEVSAGAHAFRERHGRQPGLATILVGEDPASHAYVASKRATCERAGMLSIHHGLPTGTSQAELEQLVASLAADESVDGILVQLPLPGHVDAERVLDMVPLEKDVDGFSATNLGALAMGRPALPTCTPAGIIRLLDDAGIEIAGAHAVVLGRSNIVGKPVALLLLNRSATVTICHSRTRDVPALTREADIIVSAVGSAGTVTADMVKPGATVIDVGIVRTPEGLRGDVDFEAVAEIAGAITPVPGGVGPMTVAMLMANTLEAARRRVGDPPAGDG